MKTQHTPGPWVVADDKVQQHGSTIANVTKENQWWNTTEGIATEEMPWKANAHLIAAAPELLDALSECLEQLEQLHYLYEGEFSERIQGADDAAKNAWKLIAKFANQ
jgi:hypothetical protein